MTEDMNTDCELTGNGFGLMNQIVKDGRRHSMARENVTPLVNTHVNRVIIKDGISIGMDYTHNRDKIQFGADREVNRSTGEFNPPKMMMLQRHQKPD